MDKINITIGKGLTKEQEVFAIARQLTKKSLAVGGQKKLGDGMYFAENQTQITVTRQDDVRLERTKTCGVCDSIFSVKGCKFAYSNYGGANKKLLFCSDECADTVCEIFEGRVTRKAQGYMFHSRE